MKSKYTRSFMSLSLMVTIALMLLGTSPKVASSSGTIKIGVVTDRSGAFASYGEMEVNGLHLGIEYATGGTFEVLGENIEIIVEDSFGNPTQAASKATKLIVQDNVDVLQGCASSASASAVQAVAEEYGVVFMVAPAADEKITGTGFNRYTFRTASNTWHDALTGGPFAVAYLGKTFAFLAPDYSWGYSQVNSWSYAVEKAGGEVVHIEYAPLSTVNFDPYLNRIMDASPDVLVPIWAGSGALYLFPAMADLEIYDIMNVTSGIGDLSSLQLIGVAMNFTGMTKYAYALPNNTVNEWLVDTWRARYDAGTLPVKAYSIPVPDLFVAGSFAAGQAIVYAIEQAGSTDAEDLIPVLEGLEFTSPKGWMRIRPEDHQALQSMYIAQVFNDTNSWIKDYYPNGFINLRLIAEVPPELTAPPIRGDVVSPTISDIVTEPGIATPIDNVNISATITDNLVGVKKGSLYYSTAGGLDWNEVSMEDIGDSKYRATIPKQENGTVVQYYINATDIALNSATSDIGSYTVVDLPKYYLTISVQPSEGGTTDPPVGVRSYTESENAIVTIAVAGGYEFDYWELDGIKVSEETTYTVAMYANHTLTAYVKAKPGLPIEFVVVGAIIGVAAIVIVIFLLKKRR